MPEAQRLYTRLRSDGAAGKRAGAGAAALSNAILAPLGLLGGALAGCPGIGFRLALARIAAGRLFRGLSIRSAYELLVNPLDSVRYFELGFCWQALRGKPFGSHLDVSSPRLLPLALAAASPSTRALLCNPDSADLERTRALAHELGLAGALRFEPRRVEELPDGEAFDLVTSLSVLEHIPGDGDGRAVRILWQRVRPGGRLVLTLPCAAADLEEYIDVDEYGLGAPAEHGFYFGQRFYSRAALEDRVYAATGTPVRKAIYGERVRGSFFASRARRVRDPGYPHWREPLAMARGYAHFESIDELPGIGVAALVFEKR